MKTCPGCGSGFVGFEPVCDICRRNVRNVVSKPVSKESPTNTPPVSKDADVSKSAQYMRSWREKNREKYNAYQRDLMRRRRA